MHGRLWQGHLAHRGTMGRGPSSGIHCPGTAALSLSQMAAQGLHQAVLLFGPLFLAQNF